MHAGSDNAGECAVSVEEICEALGLPSHAVVQVSEVTDLGYDRTFSVTCQAHAESPEQRWCLRVYAPSSNRARVRNAVRAFAVSGVTPRVVYSCEQWSLETWLGPTFSLEANTPQCMRQVGALIAQVHKNVPPAWFDEHVALVRKEFPALADMQQHDLAAHALVRLAGGINVDNKARDELQYRMLADPSNAALCQAWASAHVCMPRYLYAQRLVTLHGDIHPGNLVHDTGANNDLRCVDFELSAVGHAIFDLAKAVAMLVPRPQINPAQCALLETTFLVSYFQTSGLPKPSDLDLQFLRVDCLLYYFTTRYLYLRHLPLCPTSCQAILHAVHAYVLRVRHTPTLARALLLSQDPSAYIADTLGVRLHELGSLYCRPS